MMRNLQHLIQFSARSEAVQARLFHFLEESCLPTTTILKVVGLQDVSREEIKGRLVGEGMSNEAGQAAAERRSRGWRDGGAVKPGVTRPSAAGGHEVNERNPEPDQAPPQLNRVDGSVGTVAAERKLLAASPIYLLLASLGHRPLAAEPHGQDVLDSHQPELRESRSFRDRWRFFDRCWLRTTTAKAAACSSSVASDWRPRVTTGSGSRRSHAS